MSKTYRNVGTQPLLLPGDMVLPPGDTFTGELPQELVDWFTGIGAFAVEAADDPVITPDVTGEE